MENQFSSLEQIISEFNFEDDKPDKVRAKLREMQASIHPDRNKGAFSSSSDKNLFYKLSEAIQFIDKNDDTGSLVPISVVTDLTKAVTDLISAQTPKQENSLSDHIKNSIELYRSRLKLPRIALSTITIALSAVWVFPQTIQEHPILGKWFDISSITFQMAWLQVLACTILFWVFSWMNEEKQRRFQESLKTEMVQNKIFRDFLSDKVKRTFTVEEFVEFIIVNYTKQHSNLFLRVFGNPKEINLSMAHTIAEVVIKRGLSRQAIKKKNTGNISETYTLINSGVEG
jgi:hypothetical protein